MSEPIYTVEKLVGRRVVRGRVKYLVRWLGYSKDQDTWEPAENILDQALIREFESGRATGYARVGVGEGVCACACVRVCVCVCMRVCVCV